MSLISFIFGVSGNSSNKIGLEETKRYFKESYKFVCNYKNLGEKYIVSAAVHLDENLLFLIIA